jgi:hypothetical protein
VVLYIHYDLVLNNNIWQNKIISFEYILLCDVLFSLSAKKKMKIIKKTRQKKNENKIVFSKIMFVNNLQDIIIK